MVSEGCLGGDWGVSDGCLGGQVVFAWCVVVCSGVWVLSGGLRVVSGWCLRSAWGASGGVRGVLGGVWVVF